MFKKLLAIATAVVLGAGLSLVAVAAPASAHQPTVTVDCDGINYKFISYGNGTSNTFTVYVDDMVTPAFTKSFGNNVNPSEKFTWDGTVAHSVKYVINAEHNDHDFTSQVIQTSPCPPDLEKKYGICHAHPADTAANGWEYLYISINAIVGNAPNQNGNDGHTEHAADIIPAIPTILPNGQNLATLYNGLTGQQILEATQPCVLPPPDLCPNIPETQSTVPDGMVVDENGECNTPPPPPPTCIENPTVVYTYSNTQNKGEIFVTDPSNSGLTDLCKWFWVTATSWTFLAPDSVWPQKLDVTDFLPVIKTLGEYEYNAPVTCGQGDIYAAWYDANVAGFGQPIPPAQLNGPHNPWPEHFLHDMGFSGPSPTYLQHKAGCNNETPGDPMPTPAQCVEGKAGLGSIWVKLSPGKLEYTITNDPAFPDTPAANVVVPNNGDGTTALPPGHYIVTVAPLGNTIIVTGQTVWPYKIEILPPVDCHQTEIEVPASIKTDMQCEALSTIGHYTLPDDDARVEWWVGGVKKTGTQNVYFPGLVTVQARITDAAKALGVVFIGGGVTYDFPHLFVLPTPECDTTLALLEPSATPGNGSCTTAPTYTLSNTTSSHGGVQWKLGTAPNQTNTTAGVHQASWGSTVNVEATLVNDVYDGFAPETKTQWVWTFPAKPTACGDLSTLALTGATGGFVAWFAGAMLLLGGAGIYFARRRLATQK